MRIIPAVLLVFFLSIAAPHPANACEEDGSGCDGNAILASAMAKSGSLESFAFEYRFSSVLPSGRRIGLVANVFSEKPGRVYYRSRSIDATDVYSAGGVMYSRVRDEPWATGTPWELVDPKSVGLDPAGLPMGFETADFATSIEVLPLTRERGEAMRRVRVVIDGEKVKDVLSQLFVDGSAQEEAASGLKTSTFVVEYLIGVGDNHIHRMAGQFDFVTLGRAFKTTAEYSYFDFNKKQPFPTDLPVP